MHIKSRTRRDRPARSEAARVVLREARRLHHAAISDSLANSLPVLRRILSSNTLHGMSLPGLFRSRHIVRRKHILRMVAIEAGFASWEEYRPILETITPAQLEQFDIAQRAAGYPNLWFSTLDEARQYAIKHGGRSLRVGQQAVVLPGSDPNH